MKKALLCYPNKIVSINNLLEFDTIYINSNKESIFPPVGYWSSASTTREPDTYFQYISCCSLEMLKNTRGISNNLEKIEILNLMNLEGRVFVKQIDFLQKLDILRIEGYKVFFENSWYEPILPPPSWVSPTDWRNMFPLQREYISRIIDEKIPEIEIEIIEKLHEFSCNNEDNNYDSDYDYND